MARHLHERRGGWCFSFILEIQFENEHSRRERMLDYLDEHEDPDDWKDEPIPVEAPGDRVEDPVLDDDEEDDRDDDGDG